MTSSEGVKVQTTTTVCSRFGIPVAEVLRLLRLAGYPIPDDAEIVTHYRSSSIYIESETRSSHEEVRPMEAVR